MIEPTKASLRIFVSICTVIAFVSCGGLSGTRTKGGPANTNLNNTSANLSTNSPTQGDANLVRLDRFVGTWGGYAGKSTSISGQVGIDSRWMKVTVKRVTPGTVGLEGDVWDAKASLKYDATAARYLLSFGAEGFPQVADLPLTFSETEGFSGATTFTNNGKEFKAKATIKDDDKGESEWHLGVTQGKDMWNLTIRLGKEQ
jgi:hypothetical protein